MTAIIDIETDSTNPQKAKLKYFGALDVDSGEVTVLDYSHKEAIQTYVKSHKIIIGFNFKGYDKPILERFGVDFDYKVILDLYEALAPKGDNGFGMTNKDRLHDINPSQTFENYKLKTIVETLELDKFGKGEIDYSIFQKNKWTEKEEEEIRKYLKQDLVITHKLFEWYKGIFQPLEEYINKKFAGNLKYLSCTSGVLSYNVISSLTKQKAEYNEKTVARKLKQQNPRIEGGHHIHPKWEKVRGKIICRDFTSHYPTIFIMHNLLDKTSTEAIQKILTTRLQAKKKKNKTLALALKVPLNSFYGICGNPTFKNIYNPKAAKTCTEIGRKLLKRYAQALDVAGFIPLYGFTDSVYTGVPKNYKEQDLEIITKHFIEQEKKQVPNPIDSFSLGVDGKFKFMWFIEKKDNNYLCVTEDNEIKIKGGLFDVNCPEAITRLFENYIKPKIIKKLDVKFTKEELEKELKKILNKNPEFSAEKYSVKDLSGYNSKTSIQYQISEKYGPGVHALIPVTAEVGVGKNLRYCSYEDFKKHKLKTEDISFDRMARYIKPFHTTKEEVLEI